MRDTAFRIHQGEWGKSQKSVKIFSGLSNDNKGKIKTRFGFYLFCCSCFFACSVFCKIKVIRKIL